MKQRIWKQRRTTLRVTFQRNGYPEGFITSAMKLRTGQEVQQTLTEASNRRRKTLSILLYVKGTSDRIADICRKSGVPSVFQQKTIYTEGSTHKREGTTESHGQGCGVPDPFVHSAMRKTLEDQDQ